MAETLQSVIQKAEKRKLAANADWLSLLHYDGSKSVVDDPKFFLSTQGKKNAHAELLATIKAFATGDASNAKHAINRFPARLAWLLDEIPEAKTLFKATESAEFKKIWTTLKPQKIKLIFPSQYMNNPASLFGHTLLNIEGWRNEKLLAYSLNYSAITTETNGLVFAFKGVIGSYKGFYSIDPYYQKVQQYSDISMRDVWEYDLNLNAVEIQRLLMHIWEVQSIYSYYYFFDENCSYNLLFALDVARPGLNLIAKFKKPWVLPVDTIKSIKNSGLIESMAFRPSRAAKIKSISSTMTIREKQLAIDLAVAKKLRSNFSLVAGLEKALQIRIYDLTSELVAINLQEGRISKGDYRKVYLGTLSRRAKLGRTDEYQIPTPVDPVKGHDSLRLSVGGGTYDKENFIHLGIRGIYHSLDDPWPGYAKGSSIEAVKLDFYYFPDKGDVELRKLELVKISSLSPRDDFFKPKSWRADLGVESLLPDSDDDFHLSPYFYFSGGYTAGLSNNVVLLYILAGGKANFSGHFDDKHILYSTLESGFLYYHSPTISSQLNVQQGWGISGQENSFNESEFKFNWHVHKEVNLNSFFRHHENFDKSWNEYGLSFSLFF
ncbi:MAG: DUF4105 domain-containing protein [Lentisphaeria bacterium]|nr:DUF4105 domain-containing protein [Lentisphaeria bacterium]NQZ68883.1 DUF4105 domain-containing protein [Lentisphaeria bacterium]